MPKDRRSSSLDRFRASPYPPCYKNSDKSKPKSPSPQIGKENEWEEARCPICIDHPHNAVLLLCSSREKGCRPYMCDTSSRHSNCFDQFRKSTINININMNPNSLQQQQQTKLVCPLCRGQIHGWIVVDCARNFMNKKTRTCSSETCDFTGNYSELRKHARRDHPCVRPTEVDPDKELEWRILREDMEHQDIFNMQFEFDNDEEQPIDHVLEGLSELASPMWDIDLDFMNFLTNFETEFDNIFPEDGNIMMDDWENMFGILASSHEPEIRPRGGGQSWSRENSLSTTRRRSSRNGRQRANRSNQSSDTQQAQMMTPWVDFLDIDLNLP